MQTGLHLDRTKPPILEIVRDFEQVYGSHQSRRGCVRLDGPSDLRCQRGGTLSTASFSAPADGEIDYDSSLLAAQAW
jgi:hypothetical protein